MEDQSSHGMLLLPMYVDRIVGGSVAPAAAGRIVSDTPTSIVIDAENALGQVTSETAVGLCIARARAHGMAAVAVRNGFHFGTAGRWARRIAEAGHLAMVMSNTRPLMPAPGGAERVVGNNPLAIAVPSASGNPIVADVALSAGAMMKIRSAEASGEAIPDGWATDADGRPTTDPALRDQRHVAAGGRRQGVCARRAGRPDHRRTVGRRDRRRGAPALRRSEAAVSLRPFLPGDRYRALHAARRICGGGRSLRRQGARARAMRRMRIRCACRAIARSKRVRHARSAARCRARR